MDAVSNHGTLKLSKDPHHLEQGFAGWGGGVQTLLVEVEVNAGCLQVRQEGYEVL